MHVQARAANPLYLVKYLVKHPGALHCIVTVFLAEMAFLFVTWDENSVSVIGAKIKFRWPRKGIYDGTVIDSSGKA